MRLIDHFISHGFGMEKSSMLAFTTTSYYLILEKIGSLTWLEGVANEKHDLARAVLRLRNKEAGQNLEIR
jgi:hypothetical protein